MYRQTDSNSAYDAISNDYEDYSLKKINYLNSIDKLVIKYSFKLCRTLDIGSGDGRRISKITRETNPNDCLLIEPSDGMAKIAAENSNFNVIKSTAENLNLHNIGKFKNIYALWNVFGHIQTNEKRLKALKNIHDCMEDNGRFILDVNNRHNAASYGMVKVFWRRIIDYIYFKEARGDAKYDWKINGKIFKSFGHLFTPYEIEDLFHRSNFTILHKFSVDYETGKIHNSLNKGQLFYVLTNKINV